MTPERARELAIAILFGMVGNNDEIANDPSRWGDPLQSFSFDEVAVKIEEAILQACAEEREACAKNMDEAAEDVAEWGAYAPAYFQDKWNLQKAIKKWKDRAAAIRGGA